MVVTDKLTPDEWSMLAEVRNEWMSLLDHGRRAEPSEIRVALEDLFQGKFTPKIIVEDVPMINRNILDNLRPYRDIEPEGYFGDFHSEMEIAAYLSLDERCTPNLRNKIWLALQSFRTNQERVRRIARFGEDIGMFTESHLPFYDFVDRMGFLDAQTSRLIRSYISFIKLGIYEVYPIKDVLYVHRVPAKVLRDENGMLNSTKEAALEFFDGTQFHFIHSVFLPEDLWREIVNNTIDPRKAIEIKNTEQRTVACMQIGYERIVQELGGKLMDSELRNNLHYELYELDLKDDFRGPAKFIKLECPSTGKKSFERIDPDIKKCHEAVAWQFRRRPEEYILAAET